MAPDFPAAGHSRLPTPTVPTGGDTKGLACLPTLPWSLSPAGQSRTWRCGTTIQIFVTNTTEFPAAQGAVLVTVKKATDLPAADGNGLSDPYVRMMLDEKKKKTTVQRRTLNPTWNEKREWLHVSPPLLCKAPPSLTHQAESHVALVEPLFLFDPKIELVVPGLKGGWPHHAPAVLCMC